jgi:antitoxin ParD1/3/4
MPTRNVVLTDHQEELIDGLVKAGRYQNASEVLREGLRMIEHREAEDAAKLQALRDAAQLGRDAIDRGDYISFASAKDVSAYFTELAKRVIAQDHKD